MTIPKPTLNVGRAYPGWVLWALWIAATFVGALIYFVPVGVVHILLGLDRLGDPQRAGEITTGMMVLAAVLCGAACGSTIGLTQWLVLSTEKKRMGAWLPATIAGYASIGLLPLVASAIQPGWLNWASTLIISGKMHWMARVQPDWPAAASWPVGAMTLVLFGIVLGLAQWLALRGRVYQAGWWIAISVISWSVVAALSHPTIPWAAFIFTSSDIPAAIAGAGMVWLLRRPAPAFAMLSRGDLRLVLSAPNPAGGGGQPMPDGAQQAPGGWNRFAIQVDDLASTVETLRKAGAHFRNDIVTGVGGKQIILDDPSGNPIELFQPTMAEARVGTSV